MWQPEKIKESLGLKMTRYMELHPEECDVTFSVGQGSNTRIIKAIKFILKASSPVLATQFNEIWEPLAKENEGVIHIPEFEPYAFLTFIRLIMYDSWTVDTIKEFYLPANDLLNLISMCRKFDMNDAVELLEEVAEEILLNFESFTKKKEFGCMSQVNLAAVIASDKLQMEEPKIFEAACKWAEYQCRKKRLEITGESLRQELGDILFQIRFNIISAKEYKDIKLCNILTPQEKLEIQGFGKLTKEEKSAYDVSKLSFKIQRREFVPLQLRQCSRLNLATYIQRDVTVGCYGMPIQNLMKVDKRILLRGLAFLGPVDEDASYDVTVEVKRYIERKELRSSGKMTKNVFAQKGKNILFPFDEPIDVKPSDAPTNGGTQYYDILYCLMGPNTGGYTYKQLTCRVNSIQFRLTLYGQQLTDIFFEPI